MGIDAAVARLNGRRRLRLLLFLGTRPEAVKLAPVVLAARAQRDVEVRIVTSGQHPVAMLEVLQEFGIAADADLHLHHTGQTLSEVLAGGLTGFEREIVAWEPHVVVVQGDTTTALAGALASFHLRVPVAHVEAGLRTASLEQPFPEEMNRRVIDSFAEILFPPTAAAAGNLSGEVERGAEIFVTGNTVVDGAKHVAGSSTGPSLDGIAAEVWENGFQRRVLVTVHRRESWGAGLDRVAAGLARAAGRFPHDLFLIPLHPNPIVRRSFEVELPRNIVMCDPIPYGPFVRALADADLVVTDSGGVLEEATSFGKPVLVVRARTERPEAVDAGLATLVGTDPGRLDAAITSQLGREGAIAVPSDVFGDGHASERIVAWLRHRFGLTRAQPLPFGVPPRDRRRAREAEGRAHDRAARDALGRQAE